jgi:hypothetical protein
MTRHMQAGPNLGLVTSRQTKGEIFAHVQATRIPAEAICMSPKTSNNGFVFPLYLYPQASGSQRRLLIEGELTGRAPNLNPKFVAELESRVGYRFVPDGVGDPDNETFGPEDIFHYIYAVLHAPGYRERYVEFLRYDFPRIPLPVSAAQFVALADSGAALTRLHLFEGPSPAVTTNYPVPGSNMVEAGRPRYLYPGEQAPDGAGSIDVGRIYISADHPKSGVRGQYFRGVDPEVWEFRIGGYQVCEKWLKARRGRQLALSDIGHFQRMVATVARTIAIMSDLDAPVASALPEPVSPLTA